MGVRGGRYRKRTILLYPVGKAGDDLVSQARRLPFFFSRKIR